MKKNILTTDEANKILKRLQKNAKPSKQLIEYVHNTLFRDAHFLFQYKEGKQRYGYCTYCKSDMSLELEDLRTFTDNDVNVLQSSHNSKVICPCCGREVTKKYAGIPKPVLYADVAEFKVDGTGALIVYVYCIRYDYKAAGMRTEPTYSCINVGYFDLHKYFHILHGWFEDRVYLEDRYTANMGFSLSDKIINPKSYNQAETEGIKCFGLKEALQKSNLKYSCCIEYLGDGAVDMFKYLKFYCSYPEITEKLMKEGFSSLVHSYLNGSMGGCFNFRAQTTHQFLKLDKQHFKLLKSYTRQFHSWDIRAMQFFQKSKAKTNDENFDFVSKYYNHIRLIELLYKFMGLDKLKTYVKKQGALCHCRNCYGTAEYEFFINYGDYIKQCKQLGYDLNDKNVVLPANLFQAHNELTELMNRRKAEEKAKANEAKLKKFEKRLPKLKEKYTFSDGTFLIHPAESYEDLCAEGTALHHCVYSIYADKYINGKTDILFIRKVSESDKPFYTLEYYRDQVIQCRTIHNAEATEEVKAFIEKWKQFLKANKNRNKKKEAA